MKHGLNTDDGMAKKSGGKKMESREIEHRYFERPFFCPFIFLPSSWLRPKAALGISRLSSVE